ncbi:hypothetical protein [Wolbachia endosymbiont of Ctenocephalides felis wCfeJ]|uniref:hypothetical protein n=1 Tax=Wolbachia endosymbiont of Ctenocephalides felis wCfeJ TaxID=2732594 RepID=UPI001447AA9B|nr:hypothetical protein [Wolbachia endosymbiont of Ctenocephalides felis wCfeJ]WCR58213.1 MAG: hypothetical protein PG980_000685 [Wolbachia endosymbiont of Ctenocephalides felis wCfeJ]
MKIRLTLFAWMNIRDLLFSILRKNENKAYLNGDRLLALWSKLYECCNQQVVCVTDGVIPVFL